MNAIGKICMVCRFSQNAPITNHTVLITNMNRVLDNLIMELGLSVPMGDWDKFYEDK